MDNLRKCTCGGTPRVVRDDEIAPPEDSWAIYCPECLAADTHWQNDMEMAITLWNAGDVKGGNRGGQSSEDRMTMQ